MASGKLSAGRKKALQDVKNIIATNRNNTGEMSISNFTNDSKVLSKPEIVTFLNNSHSHFYDLIQNDFSRLEKGETAEQIRGVASFTINEDTESAGKVSVYRDIYNMISSIEQKEALLPLPKEIGRWNKKKAAKAQLDIVTAIRAEILRSIATKGQEEVLQYKKECAETRAREELDTMKKNKVQGSTERKHQATSRQDFNDHSRQAPPAPRRNYAGIDYGYVISFEEKSLPHPHDISENERSYYNGMQEIVAIIENYKSAIKNKSYVERPASQYQHKRKTGSSSHDNFCRTHSHEVIRIARDAIVAIMKGAEPHKICKKIPTSNPEKGFRQALDDAALILNEIDPEQIEIKHSHGYRLSANAQQVTRMAHLSAEKTTRDMSSLIKALKKMGSADELLQSGAIETVAGKRNIQIPQRRPG